MPRSNRIRFHWSNRAVRPQFRSLNEPYRRGRPWWTVPALIGVVASLAALGLAGYVWGQTGGVLIAAAGPRSVASELAARPAAIEPTATPRLATATPAPTPKPSVDDDILRRRAAAENPRPAGGWPVALERRGPIAAPTSLPAAARAEEAVYVVRAGDTFGSIAEKLGVDEAQLARLNEVTNRDRIAVGQRLRVPAGDGAAQANTAGSRSSANSAAVFRPHFIWPSLGFVTTEYGEAGAVWIGGMHMGLDIAAPPGDPVLASEAGRVLEAGWSTSRGYGNYILIDHGMGYRTLYGHMSLLRVSAGQEVARGQLIGDIGSTGVSSGPHLHFEIQDWGKPVDPIPFIGTKQPTDRLKLPRNLTAY